MHRCFTLLIPLALLALREPGNVPRPVHPPVGLGSLMDQLDAVLAVGDQDKIAQVCTRVLLARPDNYRAQMVLAELHFTAQDYRRSAGDYARVLLTYPDDTDALSGAAWSALYLGDRERAAADLARLQQLAPGYPHSAQAREIAADRQHLPPPGQAQPPTSALAGVYRPVQK